jgi:hypothetical protein
MKKKFVRSAVSTAMLSTLLVCSAANAEDVNQTITSNDVPIASTCAEAGTVALAFFADNGVTANLVEGDKILIDLPFLSATEKVTLCKSIDLLITPTAAATPGVVGTALNVDYATGGGLAWTGLNSAAPVSISNTDGTFTPVTGGVNFHVTGNQGGSRITVTMTGTSAATTDALTILGGTGGTALNVKLFDHTLGAILTDKAPATLDGLFDTQATVDENALCINVSQWLNSNVVNASLNSVGFDGVNGKYSFDATASSELAHTSPAIDYTLDQCKGATPGTQDIGSSSVSQSGSSNTCNLIDNEDNPTTQGLCSVGDVRFTNNAFIVASDAFIAANYKIQLEILVNGQTGDRGAYFIADPATNPIVLSAATTLTTGCAGTFAGGTQTPVTSFFLSNGTTAAANDAAPDDCIVATNAQATIAEASAAALGDGTDKAIMVDIPTIQTEGLVDGDVVSVRITLTKGSCNNLFSGDFEVVTMVDTCPVTATGDLLYPYFTAGNADADAFWDGIAVTNLDNAAGTVVITMFEADGDVFVTDPIALTARGMFVKTLSQMITDGMFTLDTAASAATGSGIAGDSRSHINAHSADVNIDGFGMISDPATGQSMGYLPRLGNN